MKNKIPSRIKRKRNIKIKKSTIGMFVACFAFVFSMFYVFAGENNVISVTSKDDASRGDTVNLDVNLNCAKEYNAIGVDIEFNPEVLQFVKVASQAAVANPTASDENLDDPDDPINFLAVGPTSNDEIAEANSTGKISLGYAINGNTACEDIRLARLRFKVKDNAPGGKSDVTVAVAAMSKEVGGEQEILTVDKENGYVVVVSPVDINSVELTKSVYEMQKGSSETLTVSFSPADTTDEPNYSFVSSNTAVVTVNSEGVMNAISSGSATIAVTAFGKAMEATVTVTNHITAVSISGSKHQLAKNEELQLETHITPNDTSDSKVITWESSNPSVASVDSTGKVKALTGGQTVITAKSVNNITGTYNIDVVVPITDFTTEDTTINLNKGETKKIEYTITPNDTTSSTVVNWVSSATGVATVSSDGTVTAVGGGSATITGTLSNDMQITSTVNVTVPLEKIELSKDNIELVPGQKQTISASITPEDTTEPKEVTWTSSSTTIASVNNGEITAIAPGTATITASVGGKEDTVEVKVLIPIESINISEPEVTLNRNESKDLTVIILPNEAEESKEVEWTSSDPTSVSVSASGTITGLKGTQNPVTITATLPNGQHAEATVNVVVMINSISINKTSATINKGETDKLIITIDPEDTSENTDVAWETSNSAVATVSADGTVTAVGAGNATITATVGTFSKTCAIEVKVPITSVEIQSENFELARGNNKTLTAQVNPDDTTEDTTITWSSNKPSVATVDSTGKVIAVSAGSATITATAGSKTDTVTVTVIVPITEFTINKEELSLVKFKSEKLIPTINPSDTTENTTIAWTTSNSAVAIVDSEGKVTAVGEGNATITGTLSNSMSVSCSVTVTIIPVESITISNKNLDMKRKGTETLSVTYTPEDATEISTVTWTSSNNDVATVDSTGKVTAKSAGSATITATMGSLTDTATVTVTEVHLEGITLENNKPKAVVGKDYKIDVTFEPLDATDDVTYEYESSDESIATIDSEGNVTSKKVGQVTITVKATANGQTYTKTITLTFANQASPQTGVTPIWVYGIIITLLITTGIIIYKKRAMI